MSAPDASEEPRVFLFNFDAAPLPGAAEPGVGGAVVVCWIRRDTLEEAERTARWLIAGHGWRIVRDGRIDEVTRADYEAGLPGIEYYNQCLIDGEAAVFHQFGEDAEDGAEAEE